MALFLELCLLGMAILSQQLVAGSESRSMMIAAAAVAPTHTYANNITTSLPALMESSVAVLLVTSSPEATLTVGGATPQMTMMPPSRDDRSTFDPIALIEENPIITALSLVVVILILLLTCTCCALICKCRRKNSWKVGEIERLDDKHVDIGDPWTISNKDTEATDTFDFTAEWHTQTQPQSAWPEVELTSFQQRTTVQFEGEDEEEEAVPTFEANFSELENWPGSVIVGGLQKNLSTKDTTGSS